jgi:pyruvate dehydrogenase E1 component
VRWRETDHGRHVELGIAEVNLVGLLGELGATWSRDGQPLLPVGTIYDPFLARALEPWSFGIYAGGQSILVGTPSGVTLGPEGGAHQSVLTPSIGIEQPGCVAWEPAFGRDFEWTFLHALSQLGRKDGTSAYFRLSTRPVDQALAGEADRAHVLAGGYRLSVPTRPRVTIAVMGALVPEAMAAAGELDAEVVCITSADLLFRAFQARAGLGDGDPGILEELFPEPLPIVSVLDGHPHTLSFLSAIHGVPTACLGVQRFGQSGDIGELYEHHQIDAESIVGAALDLLG